VKKGIIIVKGSSLEPPYTMRQEADKIFINEKMVYPFEVEKPKKKLLFEELAVPEAQIPDTIEETLKGFQDSWASGLQKDEKGLLRNVGLERDKDVIRDKTGTITDASMVIQDYTAQKQALEDVLKSRNIPFVETELYSDVLIPVEKEWGIVALFNEAERIEVTNKIDKKQPVPFKYPYTDAAKFKKYLEIGLNQGDMIIMDEGCIELIPRILVDAAAKTVPHFEDLTYEEKAGAISDSLALDARQPIRHLKCAVIFFPHFSWQKSIYGRNARYPFSLATMLESRKYRVWIFLDSAVTLRNWSQFLKSGPLLNMKAIYNQGHGNRNVICVGERRSGGWIYFTDQFVYKHAVLKSPVVYIHSCATLSDDRLATAFLNRGACTYGGWNVYTSGSPHYCDKTDSIFWRPLINIRATTGDACRSLNGFDSGFECRGNNRCRLR
jgi:hypothetical protein